MNPAQGRALRIRRGSPADCQPAEDVWYRSVTARDGKPPSAAVVRAVHDVLRAADATLFVAEEGAAQVAMACTLPGRDEAGHAVPGLCHLQMIFVLPEHAGAGIGGRLLDSVIADARASGMRRIQLWVREDNERAQHLYAGRGFTPTGRIIEEEGALIGMWSRSLE